MNDNQSVINNDTDNDETTSSEENTDYCDGKSQSNNETQNPLHKQKVDTTDNALDVKHGAIPPQTDQISSRKGLIFKLIFIFLLPLIAIIFQNYFIPEFENNSDVINSWHIFETQFKSFELKYKHVLPVYGIRTLKLSVKDVITRNNSQLHSPAIILLIGSERNQNILECIERDFVDSINKAYNEMNPIVINGKQTNSRDIIDSFDKNFRDDKKHTIIIKNIESIDGQDMMSLHQFTDHENARYNNVIIVMTAINYKEINLDKSASLKDMDSIATQLFQIKWKNALREEQSSALIARLTPSVVTIIGKRGDQLKC